MLKSTYMDSRIEQLYDLEYWNHSKMCVDILQKWFEIKPDNDETQAMISAIQEMNFYVMRIKGDSLKKDKLIKQYKDERNKWCVRANEAERKLEPIIKEFID
tara:strand:- start:135 stop:440 length:306 start_codon:yes stop_codon:yes gene_type:complete